VEPTGIDNHTKGDAYDYNCLLYLLLYNLETRAVSMLSNRVAMINAQARFSVDRNAWPPNQSNIFTPLLLVYHESQQSTNQVADTPQLVQGNKSSNANSQFLKLNSNVPNASKMSKHITDILIPLQTCDEPQLIVIEGAPGIGKSVLLREIAYRWSKQQLLEKFTLVLFLCLRDPIVQQASSISDLLLTYCKGDKKAKQIAAVCSDHLFEDGGKSLLFLFDGYDEIPECLRDNSMISEILNRSILPLCGIVVSSRPHASVTIREQATVKVDILGFTEEEQHNYIERSLKEKPQSIEKLTSYLKDHPAISNLCLVPFNIAILLFLHKMGVSLPRNSIELYHHFVCLTICRHLAKSGCLLRNNIKCLTDLPEPYNKMLEQLSKLALGALNSNQLVFTYEEIKATCPDIIKTPGAINGFGLLQAIEHFGLTGKTITFNFLHLTIQEYLAAYYVINYLPSDEEICLLCKKFWSNIHENMFSIYITLTKGQQSAFKTFLSDGDSVVVISSKFLCDQLKCIQLFHCFFEAGDERMCESIKEAAIFDKREIALHFTKLSGSDLVCISSFLTTFSYKHWMKLDLQHCYIRDHGLHIVHKFFTSSNVAVVSLMLTDNGLTQLSSSMISDIVLRCYVERLWISLNHLIGENKDLYAMLSHPSSMLTHLYMNYIGLSSTSAKALLAAVMDSNRLEGLYVYNNVITDDVAEDIATTLTINSSLVRLEMSGNPISGEAIIVIVQALLANNTLQRLGISCYPPETEEKIRSIEHEVNKARLAQGIQKKLVIGCWRLQF